MNTQNKQTKQLARASSLIQAGLLLVMLSGVGSLLPRPEYRRSVATTTTRTNETRVLPATVSVSKFDTGVTLTQYSLDAWGDTAAVTNARSLLNASTKYVNQHVMGFGALSPEESPDVYDFSSIQTRVGNVSGTAKTADTIVLTACCAPDWMKGGSAGSTNWADIEEAPLASYYDDYAELIVEIVQDPEFSNVEYLQVWNEMKGMWNPGLNRWDHEGYTNLYNQIWDGVKAVRPDIKIGGPYVVLNSRGGGSPFDSTEGGDWGLFDQRDLDVVTYWLQNKNGADFITVDGKNRNRDGVELVDQYRRTEKYQDFMTWLRGLNNSTYPGAQTLPVWWAEWYSETTAGDSSSPAEKNSVMATGLIHTIKSGASTALIWAPQGDTSGDSFPLGIFSDTRVSGGGQATLFYDTQRYVDQHFSTGANLIEIANNNSNVESISTSSKTMLVNQSATSQTATLRGESFVLGAYDVSLVDTPELSTENPDDNTDDPDDPETPTTDPTDSSDDTNTSTETLLLDSNGEVVVDENGDPITLEEAEEKQLAVDPETGELVPKAVLKEKQEEEKKSQESKNRTLGIAIASTGVTGFAVAAIGFHDLVSAHSISGAALKGVRKVAGRFGLK